MHTAVFLNAIFNILGIFETILGDFVCCLACLRHHATLPRHLHFLVLKGLAYSSGQEGLQYR